MITDSSHPRYLANQKSREAKMKNRLSLWRVREVKPTPAIKLRALRKAAKHRRAKEISERTANVQDRDVPESSTTRAKSRPPTRRGASPVRPLPLLSLDDITPLPKGYLGKGTFAKVHAVRVNRDITNSSEPGPVFAIKSYRKKVLQDPEDKLKLIAANLERKALYDLPWSPWICSAIDVFHDEDHLHLMLEYIPGETLYKRIYQSTGPLDADIARFYYCNIACALEFLHDHDIIHNDLKPENILIKEDGYLCLSDFGAALPVKDMKCAPNFGTVPYLAPEKIEFDELLYRLGYGVDWWASGIILYEMVTQLLPFDKPEDDATEACIMKGEYGWPSNMLVGKVLESFVSELLQLDPSRRLGTTIPVKNHPWLANVDWDMLEAHRYRASWTPSKKIFD